MKQYPRVVIVTANPLRRDMANGILLSSLFEGWPTDRLAQVYFPAGLGYLPDFDVCREFSMIRTSGSVRRITANECPNSHPRSPHGHPWKRTILRRIKRHQRLLSYLRVGQEFWNAFSWLGRRLERELCHLRPEIVFADMGNFCLTRITCRACQNLGIPMYLHVGDYYVHALYRGMPLQGTLQALSEYWFREAVSYADGLETVSPLAADEFQRRYGREWEWFTALADPDQYDDSPRTPDGVVRLVYAGNMELERWRSLRQLGFALQALQNSSGIQVELDIYSTPEQLGVYGKSIQVPGITNLRGWVPREKLPTVLQQADILVHVESMDHAVADYAQWSFSTKLSDYMMAGRCILAFGLRDLASMRTISLAGAGVVVDETNVDSLPSVLQGLIENIEQRSAFGRSGRAWALKWFNLKTRRESFRQAIVAALTQARSRGEPIRRAA